MAALCQPDRPAGRGNKLTAPPVKQLAAKFDIPVLQPEKLSKEPEVVERMKALKPDVIVMLAFGQILRKAVLEMAPYGVVNLHGSLLPKYRGPAPINWAIINGETISGATTMISDAGVDTGPMLLKKEMPIGPETNAVELAQEMSQLGADLVIDTLKGMRAGTVKAMAQDSAQATYAPMLFKEMGRLDWTKSALELHNLVRGLQAWPSTYTSHEGNQLKITRTRVAPDSDKMAAGTVEMSGQAVTVACGDGTQRLEFLEVQPANRSKMNARDWANGVRLRSGIMLGSTICI